MRLVGEVPRVAASVGSDGSDGNGGELRARSVANGLASIVVVKVPGEQLVLGRVDLGSLDALRNGLAVVSSRDLDVESLSFSQQSIENIKMF